ncbi:MAG: hypothetical protein WC525_09085 [Candidatus Thermoplasmatota archaeon]
MDPHIDNEFDKAYDTLGADLIGCLHELDPQHDYRDRNGTFAVEIERKGTKQFVVITLQDFVFHLVNGKQDRYEKITIPVSHLAEAVLFLFK